MNLDKLKLPKNEPIDERSEYSQPNDKADIEMTTKTKKPVAATPAPSPNPDDSGIKIDASDDIPNNTTKSIDFTA